MAFTDALDVSIGAATKASDYDNLADNTEFNREKTNAEHDLDISTGAGKHKSISFLNSTDVIALKAGSASLPPLTAEGDLNTGMFFPAADTLGWATAGALRLKIDPSGNVITSGKAVIGKSTSDTQDLVIEQSADNTLGGLRIYETGGVDWAALYSSGGVAYLQNQDTYMSLNPNGVAINDGSGSANMTVGLTINQGANDDQILAFKSSDVAHGMTNFGETDTFATIAKAGATTGGIKIGGLSEATVGVDIQSFYTTVDTTKSTSGLGAIRLGVALKDGVNIKATTADGNLVSISDLPGTGAVFLFDVEGSGHADVAWTTYDTYNDLSLISDMEDTLLAIESPDQTPRRHAMEATGIIGKDSWHMENGKPKAMVNFTKLAMLHHGALIQTGDRFRLLEDRLEQTEAKLLLAETKLNRLEN